MSGSLLHLPPDTRQTWRSDTLRLRRKSWPLCRHVRSSPTSSLTRWSSWRQTTIHWYSSWAVPISTACHHKSYASRFASCNLATLLVMFQGSSCTLLTRSPVPQSLPQMSTTFRKAHRQNRLCMHLPRPPNK